MRTQLIFFFIKSEVLAGVRAAKIARLFDTVTKTSRIPDNVY